MVGILLCGYSCSADYSPKPVGYPHINIEEATYVLHTGCSDFGFDINENATLSLLPSPKNEQLLFNLVYPELNTLVYCSYHVTDALGIERLTEETMELLQLQGLRAERFSKEEFANPEEGKFAEVYTLQGKVSAPILFYLTDNDSRFLRGTLQFDTVVNQDSIAPVIDYIHKDIQVLIETFQWKK